MKNLIVLSLMMVAFHFANAQIQPLRPYSIKPFNQKWDNIFRSQSQNIFKFPDPFNQSQNYLPGPSQLIFENNQQKILELPIDKMFCTAPSNLMAVYPIPNPKMGMGNIEAEANRYFAPGLPWTSNPAIDLRPKP